MLSKTVGEYLGKNVVPGDIGIEVEVEFDGPPAIVETDTWRTTEDGSLRNGVEYVLRSPIKHSSLQKALAELEANTGEASFQESIRTSVHVHINAGAMTWEQVFAATVAYLLVENILVEPHGSFRKGNLHCLRAKDADSFVNMLCDSIRILKSPNSTFAPIPLFSDRYRYASLNLCALGKYRSMEFRFLRGMTDTKDIYFWTDVLYMLVRNGMNQTVASMVDLAGRGQNEKEILLDRLFGPVSKTLIDLAGDGWQGMIEENVVHALRILKALSEPVKNKTSSKTHFFIRSTISDDLESDEFLFGEKPDGDIFVRVRAAKKKRKKPRKTLGKFVNANRLKKAQEEAAAAHPPENTIIPTMPAGFLQQAAVPPIDQVTTTVTGWAGENAIVVDDIYPTGLDWQTEFENMLDDPD